MQIQSIPSRSTNENTRASVDTTSAVDFQSFLRLLTAQLRNQDPLSPLESTQFVAQLASFSTVEQLVSANAKLDAISQRSGGEGLEAFSDWIGRSIEVEGASIRFSGAPEPFRIIPRDDAISINLVIRDELGVEVDRIAAANLDIIQNWFGQSAATGSVYSLETEYTLNDGSKVVGPAITRDVVSQIRETSAGIVLDLVGGDAVQTDSVRAIGSADRLREAQKG